MIQLIEKWSYDYIKMDCEEGKCYGVLAVSAFSPGVSTCVHPNRFTASASLSHYSISFSVFHSSAFVIPVTSGRPFKMGECRSHLFLMFVHIMVVGGGQRFYFGSCLSSYPSSSRMASSYSGETTFLLSVPRPSSFLAWFSWWTLPTPGQRLVSRNGRTPQTRTSGNGSSSVRQAVCMRQRSP